MDRISNNLIAMLLVFTLMISVLGTSMALFKLDSFRYLGTGKVAGIVGVCVSNAPIMTAIGDINISQNDYYFNDVNDTQSTHGSEVVRFYDNSTVFDINQTNGTINFTATNAMVGYYWVLVWANESACGMMDSELINLTIHNVNDAPILDFIPDQVLYEDQVFIYDVNATDPDFLTPGGDTITFGDNTTLFVINPTTGNISFMPVNAEAGQNYSILVYVFDSEYLDSQAVNFEIIAVNDAPVLDFIGAKTAIINVPFFLDVNATDEEGDNLTFYDNSSIFDINNTTGIISFTANSSMINNYSINISVSDGDKWDFEVISFTVVGANNPPNITQWFPSEQNYSRATEIGNKSTRVWYYEGYSINLRVNATDPDGTTPSYIWVFNNVTLPGQVYNNYTYYASVSGTFYAEVFATDGLLNDTHNWTLAILERPSDEPPSGGGGGGGGPPPVDCFENWRCTYWSVCNIDESQTRSCIDLNDCGTELNKPTENRSCFYSPYPGCFDGIKNCHDGMCEIMVDCGGVCGPCPTCDDGIRNQGEQMIDCGGPCQPCGERCIDVPTSAINSDTGECRVFEGPCMVPKNWEVVDECPPIQPIYILLYIIVLAFIATAIILMWLQREAIRSVFISAFKFGGKKKRKVSREERIGKEAIESLSRLGKAGAGRQKPKKHTKKPLAPTKPKHVSRPGPAHKPRQAAHRDAKEGGKRKEGSLLIEDTLNEIDRIQSRYKKERKKKK
jgi:hypothetical protein